MELVPAPRLSWHDLSVVAVELGGESLDLTQTLDCGQAFRWTPADGGAWVGAIGDRAMRLELAGDWLLARNFPELPAAGVVATLRNYLALDVAAGAIRDEVAHADARAREAVGAFAGLRLLRQPAEETLLTFAIASATNVPRIKRSIDRLCATFGAPIAEIDGRMWRAFPTPGALAAAPVDVLAGPCNLAYRAGHLRGVARALAERSDGWLGWLAGLPYPLAHAEIDALAHIGPKIADCVCLFGLARWEAVPVDAHIWAIARELFGERIPTRSLTARTYRAVGDLYRERFGRYAGWAQQYLYAARRATRRAARARAGVSA